MRGSQGLLGPLFRHDCRIAINTVRATFSGLHDRLIAVTMLLAALAVVYSWFADQSWKIAAWAALGAGIMVGMGAARMVAARLSFHGSDGLLAAEALHPTKRRRYMVAWYGIGIALLAGITLIARPSLLIVAAPAYLAGVFVAQITANIALPGAGVGKARPGWTIRRCLQHPGAGIVAAMILLLSLLPAYTVETNARMTVIGIEAVLLALPLTVVDDAIVRFMTISGHGSWSIVGRHARGMLPFAGVTIPACWFAFGPIAAGIVAAVLAALLLLTALRVLAYCCHGKRFADFLTSILAALLILVASSMPVALPFVVVAILGQLQRRAAAKTWLLA